MNQILGLLLAIFILVITHIIPVGLTFFNLLNLFLKKKIKPNLIDGAIFILGPLYMLILYIIWEPKKWEKRLELPMSGAFSFHEPISGEHFLTFFLLLIIALVGYIVLRNRKRNLPPLLIVTCIASMYIGIFLNAAIVLQLSQNMFTAYQVIPTEVFLMCLFPINYIISSISLIREIVLQETELEEYQEKQVLSWCGKLLKSSRKWPFLALLMMVPLLGIVIIILTLFGQQPDGVVRMFTNTSDWLFSQKISPTTIFYDDHYLCTVAAGGHPQVVKPQRMGIRLGQPIIVNRQLCIANAFEELIAEKAPKFHRSLRKFYDTYGYPISKHIKKKWMADATYIIMKPLEWLFLFVLYLFDLQPEKRISKQYRGN